MKSMATLLRVIHVADLILFFRNVSSQSKFEVAGSIGIPDMLSLKIKFGKELQFGFSQGYMPDEQSLNSVIELYYHFAGKSRIIDQQPWYLAGGLLCFCCDKSEASEGNALIIVQPFVHLVLICLSSKSHAISSNYHHSASA